MTKKIKVLLIEDDLDFVFLIKKMIEQDVSLDYCGHAVSGKRGIELAKSLAPEVVLIDLNLSKSNLDGVEAAREIRISTEAKILLLTSFEQPEIIINASKRSLASGYIFKSQCQNLTDIIQKTVLAQTPQAQFIKELFLQVLTPAERHIVNIILGAETSAQSAEKTVANQKTSIFKKLGIKNTNELIHIFRSW